MSRWFLLMSAVVGCDGVVVADAVTTVTAPVSEVTPVTPTPPPVQTPPAATPVVTTPPVVTPPGGCPIAGNGRLSFFPNCIDNVCLGAVWSDGFPANLAALESVLGPREGCGEGSAFEEACWWEGGDIEVTADLDAAGEPAFTYSQYTLALAIRLDSLETSSGLSVGVDSDCFEAALGPGLLRDLPVVGAPAGRVWWPMANAEESVVGIWPASGVAQMLYVEYTEND